MSEKVQKFCNHCHKPYMGDKRSKYCCGTHKSIAYRERKEKMLLLLVEVVHASGYPHFTVEHAFKVIESYHNNVKKILENMGFTYDNFTHVWVKV